ncbi:hypothetical protein [Aneurinibacillus tyrosinisolvens]|uniref:hypothetical protein n=1 Tax=Aneurinibacillus tyrosinisolvens TaxID=1443435 RepID=UPI00063F72F6|nr:hypothetical protein [Aneurinibacillus tyrosinisolvens]
MKVDTPMKVLQSLEKVTASGKYNMLTDENEILRELSRTGDYEAVSYLTDITGAYLRMKRKEYIHALEDLATLKEQNLL